MNVYFTVGELSKKARMTGVLLATALLSGCASIQETGALQETTESKMTVMSENDVAIEIETTPKVDSVEGESNIEVVDIDNFVEIYLQEYTAELTGDDEPEKLQQQEQEPLQYIYNISHDHSFYETFGVEEFYTLQQTYQVRINHDVDASTDMTAKNDKIEVYTGNVGDGDSGIVLVYSGDGANEPYSIEAHTARAGWTNIYLISKEDKDYLLELQLDIRGGFGELRYVVYAFGEQAGRNLAVSVEDGMFYAYENETFDDTAFMEWADNMEKWLEQAELLLSTQDGEVRIEPSNDMERYCAEELMKMIEESAEG